MAAQKGKKPGKGKGSSMMGTFLSLGVVGGVILLTYFVLFGLFMARY
ncbi:cytochrome c oxidase subunit 2A [Neobacillus piezotolerans]|nr:cytochrome c oxidase subunit 2A [Neobacillus piezotolerans]